MSKDSIKRGYLNDDFRIFHLKDNVDMNIDFHHHDFNKIVVLLGGEATYYIEGKSYNLKPYDILLVAAHEVHKPYVTSSTDYERVIFWVNSNFLKSIDNELFLPFHRCVNEGLHLLRMSDKNSDSLKRFLGEIIHEFKSSDFGSNIFCTSLLLQFMVMINRMYRNDEFLEPSEVSYDKFIWSVIRYINENLNTDLSIDTLASKFFISRYHLMHKFKIETGYTLHSYILEKRLSKSKDMLLEGKSIQEICTALNFNDYSNFMRQFKKRFGKSPGTYKNHLLNFSSMSASTFKE